MPCIAGNFGAAGVILQFAIFRNLADLASITQPPTTGQSPKNVHIYDALLDTGATSTCLSPRVIREVGLTPIGKVPMISASQVCDTNQYIFTAAIVMGLQQHPTGALSGQFTPYENITGLEFAALGTSYDILVGMDIIKRGSFKIDFDGHFSFSV